MSSDSDHTIASTSPVPWGKRPHAGRPGGAVPTRGLVALLGAMDEDGATITVSAVAERLGLSEERARELVDQLLYMETTDASYLPVYEEGDSVRLEGSRTVRGRAIRLTRSETYAVLAALDRIGISGDDPLRKRLVSSLSAASVDAQEALRMLAPPGDAHGAEVVRSCVDALLAGHAVTFSYRGGTMPAAGTGDAVPERHAVVRSVYQDDGTWYVDGFDLDRQAIRTYRADRMGEVADAGPASPATSAQDEETAWMAAAPRVTVRFSNRSYLALFVWPGLEVVGESPDGSVTATLPVRAGDWLARHLVACGGTATTTDPALAARMRELAAETLAAGTDALTRGTSATS